MISQEAHRLASMAQDVMDYARGSITTQKRRVQLAAFLGRAELTLKPYFSRAGSRFTIRCETDEEVLIDPDRFLRVLVNIAANAAHVLGPDGWFEISAERIGRKHVLGLRDNGPGIPLSIRETLFEPFVTAGKSEGTGLGMAISKSIVEAHGGSIRFETREGQGTVFIIEIPAPDYAAEPTEPDPQLKRQAE